MLAEILLAADGVKATEPSDFTKPPPSAVLNRLLYTSLSSSLTTCCTNFWIPETPVSTFVGPKLREVLPTLEVNLDDETEITISDTAIDLASSGIVTKRE